MSRVRLLVVFGPPSVGKMTVGREIARASDFRLHHNHAFIEPLLEVFPYESAMFQTLVAEFRRRLAEEAAASGTDLVMTFVWGLDLATDADLAAELCATYESAGGEVAFLELYADLATRLDRNGTPLRLEHKPSKRDREWSDQDVRDLERWQLNTDPVDGPRRTPADAVLASRRHLRVDNTHLEPAEVAARALAWLDGSGAPHV